MIKQSCSSTQLGTQPARLRALCSIELLDGAPPEWIQLFPAGEKIETLDGRTFANADPQSVVDAFHADPRDLVIDWEHATEKKAGKGEEAPASAWVDRMEVRNAGEIWGHVKEWTPRGATSLQTKEYRYFSPSFIISRAGALMKIISGALTNRPAFDMPALAHAHRQNTSEEHTMEPDLLKLLGLKEDATSEQIRETVTAMVDKATAPSTEKLAEELAAARAENQGLKVELTNARTANPALEKFVPRADYDAVVARAQQAESSIQERDKQEHASEVKRVVDQAQKDGKITPASREFYVETCATKEGLESFKKFVVQAPEIAPASGLDAKSVPTGIQTQLTSEQKKIAAQCGLSEEEFLKELAEEGGQK